MVYETAIYYSGADYAGIHYATLNVHVVIQYWWNAISYEYAMINNLMVASPACRSAWWEGTWFWMTGENWRENKGWIRKRKKRKVGIQRVMGRDQSFSYQVKDWERWKIREEMYVGCVMEIGSRVVCLCSLLLIFLPWSPGLCLSVWNSRYIFRSDPNPSLLGFLLLYRWISICVCVRFWAWVRCPDACTSMSLCEWRGWLQAGHELANGSWKTCYDHLRAFISSFN